jgi:hypothetical protein
MTRVSSSEPLLLLWSEACPYGPTPPSVTAYNPQWHTNTRITIQAYCMELNVVGLDSGNRMRIVEMADN